MASMRRAFGLTFLALLPMCAEATPTIVSPPAPPPHEVAAERNVQTRVVQVRMESVVPRAIEVLMDNNFVVRSVDAKLGFVSFYRQWVTADPDAVFASVSEEGSILFTPATADSTQIRVSLTGSWSSLVAGGVGIARIRGGAGQRVEQAEYRKILDMLQVGLTKH